MRPGEFLLAADYAEFENNLRAELEEAKILQARNQQKHGRCDDDHKIVPAPMLYLSASVFVICVTTIAAYRIWWHPLRAIPGPKIWASSRLPWLWHMTRGDLWQALERLHEQYGDTIRIAPNEVTTRSVEAWQEIYVSRPLLLKDPRSLTPPLNGADSLFTAQEEKHRRIRGVLAHAFSGKALREQAVILEAHASKLILRLRRDLEQNPGETIDINRYFGYVTFDTVTDLSYGESTNCLDVEEHQPWVQRFFLHAQHSTIRNSLRWYSPLDRILDTIFLRLTRATRERNWQNTTNKIDRRLAKGDMTGTRVDLLSPIIGRITADSESTDKGMTKQEVLSYAVALVIADSQLTTAALTSCAYFVARNSWAWGELAKEIRTGFTNDDQITVQSTLGLSFLDAVLNETLRLQHPSPISLPRVLPAGQSRVVGELHISGNTIVGISLQNIQLSPKYWHDPHSFRPERFLSPDDARYDTVFAADNKAAFMPFSTGPRNCIGAKLFFAQARLALAKLIWHYDVVLANPVSEAWLNPKVFIVLEPRSLYVKLIKRDMKT